jgi:hypothetical protein
LHIADFINGALTAWIKTVPQEPALQAYLLTVPGEHRSLVQAEVRSAFDCADSLLNRAAQQGPVDLAEFHQDLNVELISTFDWIDESGLSSLRSYTGWYAWHEGYLKP